MKKILTISVICLLFGHINAVAKKGDLLVYRLSGKVTQVKDGKAEPLQLGQELSLDAFVNVEYESVVELIDSENQKRFTIKTPGKGTIRTLAAKDDNSVTSLTAKYISYVKNQLASNSQMVSAQKFTDFATVTRERKSVEQKKDKTPKERYEENKEKMRDSYNAYRRDITKKYNDHVRMTWEAFRTGKPIPMPQEKDVKPVVFNEEQHTDRLRLFGWRKKEVKKADRARGGKSAGQPQPLAEIKEKDATKEETKYKKMPFVFFGTDMEVRLDESKRFNMGEISPGKVADLLDLLNTSDYDNLLYDCLQLRKSHNLCDWAYLEMLQCMSEQFCGPHTNESVLLTGYLLSQSGYKIRYAMSDQTLYLLVGSECVIYDRCNFQIQDCYYYPLTDDIPDNVYLCPASMEKEQGIAPDISVQPQFVVDSTSPKTWTAVNKKSDSVTVSVNKNLIDFYNTYPKFELNHNSPCRWAAYANTPMDDMVKSQLYPQIQKMIEGKGEKEAVGVLLNWIQYAFPYEFDDVMWGCDRTFFAEETLHYKACDCEDRAVLLTRLVRDLLGLKCVLVYYPGHLAAAIHFNEQVKGDSYVYDGMEYTVCDPTYVGADVGMQMPELDCDAVRLIILD